MTAQPTPTRPARPQPTRRHLDLAGELLRRNRLKPARGVDRDQVRLALARALALTSPVSAHGQLLTAALRPHPGGQRPAAQQAARSLLRRGETPTAAAVATLLDGQQRHQAATAARTARVAGYVERDGQRAAQTVADYWQQHGCGPTWRELARLLGWPELDADVTVKALAAAGWLEPGSEPRSLRPGRRPAAPG